MKRRDYYFIAGGIFIFIVAIYLTVFFVTRKAQGQQALAVALETPPSQQPNYARKAVAAPQTGFIGGNALTG